MNPPANVILSRWDDDETIMRNTGAIINTSCRADREFNLSASSMALPRSGECSYF